MPEGTVSLTAGHLHKIRIEYSGNFTLYELTMEWESASQWVEVIPSTQFYTPDYNYPAAGIGTGLQGDYFNNTALEGDPALQRVDEYVGFHWGTGSPDALITSGDNYSVRWSGQIQPLFSEEYDFIVYHLYGARLTVNDVLLVDNWNSSGISTGSISLTAGQHYDIVLEYRDPSFDSGISLHWQSQSQHIELVPTTQLYPPP